MKKAIKRPLLLTAILLVLALLGIAYMRGDIGMSEKSMTEREMAELQEERSLYGGAGESMAVFLDFREDLTDIHMDVYVKRKGSIGWFFRYGHASDGPQNYLVQMNCEGNDEYVLMCLGADPAGHIEVEKDDSTRMTINPELGKPFAYVMNHKWNVTVYDKDGGMVIPHERNM